MRYLPEITLSVLAILLGLLGLCMIYHGGM